MENKETEVMELIDNLYTMVSEAWGVPLGNDKCILERDKVLEILNDIKTCMPVEISEAKRLVLIKDDFINNAKREAEAIRKNAETKARTMLEEQEIFRVARERSEEMVSSAELKSKELCSVASNYIEEVLRQAEDAVSSALQTVSDVRENFRKLAPKEEPTNEEISVETEEASAE